MNHQAQQSLGKDFDPPVNDDIERAASALHVARRDQKAAAATTRQAHATLVLHMQNAGLEAYPWTNPDTGRKRNIVITREPKAKETKPASARAERRSGRVKVADKVESKRVKRTAEHDKLADPFGATRNKMASPRRGKKR